MVGYSHLPFHFFCVLTGHRAEVWSKCRILLHFYCAAVTAVNRMKFLQTSLALGLQAVLYKHDCRTPKGLIKFQFSQPWVTSFNLTDTLIGFFSSMNICEECSVSFGRANSLLLLEARLVLWLSYKDPKTQRCCGSLDVGVWNLGFQADLIRSSPHPLFFYSVYSLWNVHKNSQLLVLPEIEHEENMRLVHHLGML